MKAALNAHIYVLGRFVRLDAPPRHLEMELARTLDAYRESGGDPGDVEGPLRALLEGYRTTKAPLIAQGHALLRQALPDRPLEQSLDPCYLAQRAEREGWTVTGPVAMQQLLALASQCDQMDRTLVSDIRRLLTDGLGNSGNEAPLNGP